MKTIPKNSSAEEVLCLIDKWIALLERENYDGACALTGNDLELGIGPDVLMEAVKEFGQMPNQRVTVEPARTPNSDMHVVSFYEVAGEDVVGDVDYRLNFDGKRSDRWAEFAIREQGDLWFLELKRFNN